MTGSNFILNLTCEDRTGIVAAVATRLAEHGANIAESHQFWDRQTNLLFMRVAFTAPAVVSKAHIAQALEPVVQQFDMTAELVSPAWRPSIVIMVSRFDHAVLHLLYQLRVGWLEAQVAAIVSNHQDCSAIAEREGIRFEHWPVNPQNRQEQEARLVDLVGSHGIDLVVLARYMQVLSNDLSNRLYGKVINIHHSFLPSFKGAKPYHQAFERGVKLIGATAHYVTSDLDEGPIIEQETERVTHAMSAMDLVAAGRNIESRVLARAVKLHLERRVMLNGHRTVVFN